MTREEVTEKIRVGKVRNGLSWVSIAEKIGKSPEWTTAACLGQFPFSKEEAEKLGELFNLTNEDVAWLQVIPYRNVKHTVPEDPTLYRLHE
uniref:Cyanate hydratase n=1 Tax=Acrobeloides nanus TaxID=290746 RepID=A0A914C1I2_9BILA